MPTLREELAQIRARQQPTVTQTKEAAASKIAAQQPAPQQPTPAEEESIRKIEDMNRRHELRQWGQEMKEQGVTVPFGQWQKRAWQEQLKGLRERIESGGDMRPSVEEAPVEETRGPGLQAPIQEGMQEDGIYEPFDELGQQTPFWQPDWIRDVTGNELMRNPRELRGDLGEGWREKLDELRKRLKG